MTKTRDLADLGGGFIQDGTGSVQRTVEAKLQDVVSVKDFGAKGDGTTDDLAAFNSAVAAANWGHVYVPPGDYVISAPTTGDGNWHISGGAVILGLPGVGPANSLQDCSRLTGNVFHEHGKLGQPWAPTVCIGSSNHWLTKNWKTVSEYIPKLNVTSSEGVPGGYFSTLVSTGSPSSTGYAVGATCVSNDTTNQYGGWSAYFEGIRGSGTTGSVINLEMDLINLSTPVPVTPGNIFSDGITVGLWLSSGGGSSAPYGGTGNDNSLAIGIISNPNQYIRGIVARANSIETTGSPIQEVLSTPLSYGWAWYYPHPVDTVCSFIDHRQHKRRANIADRNVSSIDESVKIYTGGSTNGTDVVYKHNFFGSPDNGVTEYLGATFSVKQKTDFSSNEARFSYTFDAHNSGAGGGGLEINAASDASVTPLSDNSHILGHPSYRWTTVYATTGTINTSDARAKQDIEALNAAEKRVATAVKGLVKKFRFIDAFEAKGEQARIHVGVVAQEVAAAFAAEGLDASNYGLFCRDQLENGSDQYGVRYEELLAFIIAAL